MSTDAQRRLILHMSVSLDGFSAVGNGAPDWRALEDPPGLDHGVARHQANVDLVSQMGMIVIGRGAYEDMVRAWPGTDSPMGSLMNTLPKVIFSDSLTDLHWENARLNERPLEEEIPRLKAEPGRDIVALGGPRFAHSLIANHLVDEYRLTVHSVALGRGIPVMHGLPEPRLFALVNAAVYTDGTLVHTLRPA